MRVEFVDGVFFDDLVIGNDNGVGVVWGVVGFNLFVVVKVVRVEDFIVIGNFSGGGGVGVVMFLLFGDFSIVLVFVGMEIGVVVFGVGVGVVWYLVIVGVEVGLVDYDYVGFDVMRVVLVNLSVVRLGISNLFSWKYC